ncbi:hypothetical protein WN943_025382 [Citrus x changshan-huyou]
MQRIKFLYGTGAKLELLDSICLNPTALILVVVGLGLSSNSYSRPNLLSLSLKAEAKRLRLLGVEKVDTTVRVDIAQNWKKLTPEERHQWMVSNMNEISSSNSGENSGTSKNIEESDEEKTDGGNLLSRCRVASFSDVVSSFSSDQQVAVNETGLGSLLDLKCGRLRQELCAALIEQCDVGTQSIILHGKEYNLSPTTFATIMGVRDGGTRVDFNDQVVDITNLHVVYSSGPRGIHIAEVSMRDYDRLHKPQQAEPLGWNNANNDAFQLLMERFGPFVAQNKELFQTIERRLENIEKILGELTSKYHGGSSKQPVAPDPPSSLKSQNRTSPDGKTMSKTEGK